MRTRWPPRLVRTIIRIVWSAKEAGMGGGGTIGAGGGGPPAARPDAGAGGGPAGRARFIGTRSCAVAQLATQCSRAAIERAGGCPDTPPPIDSRVQAASTAHERRLRAARSSDDLASFTLTASRRSRDRTVPARASTP
jgi:hypothetical protein